MDGGREGKANCIFRAAVGLGEVVLASNQRSSGSRTRPLPPTSRRLAEFAEEWTHLRRASLPTNPRRPRKGQPELPERCEDRGGRWLRSEPVLDQEPIDGVLLRRVDMPSTPKDAFELLADERTPRVRRGVFSEGCEFHAPLAVRFGARQRWPALLLGSSASSSASPPTAARHLPGIVVEHWVTAASGGGTTAWRTRQKERTP